MILYKGDDALMCKEYSFYRVIKKQSDHLFNLKQKQDESLRDYIKRFLAEKSNIVGCEDRIASSDFKKGLLTEHNLYRELAITLSQTLAEVFTTVEHYGLWDDDWIDEKKSGKQVDHPLKEAIHRNDGSYNGNNLGKRKSRSIRGSSSVDKSYT
ncbi:unnamed protein product [Prunus armeniaca]